MTGIRTNTVVGIALAAAALASCGGGVGPTGDDQLADASSVASASPLPTDPAPTDPPAAADTADTAAPPPADAPSGTAPAPASTTPAADPGAADAGADSSSAGASKEAPTPSAVRGISRVEQLVVRDQPDGVEVASLPARTAFGTPMVVGVMDRVGDWVQIQVPVRPNDLTGWVRVADVELEPVYAEIRIDLATRTLRLTEDGRPTGEWAVAIGRPDRPTPTGSYYITDKIATGDPDSVWGAHAFGLSAYSDVLTDFIGGIGQIGLHGTNDPSSIGQDASSGCIRLPNEVIDELIDRLPLGTPVLIT